MLGCSVRRSFNFLSRAALLSKPTLHSTYPRVVRPISVAISVNRPRMAGEPAKHVFEEIGLEREDVVYFTIGAPGTDALKDVTKIMLQATEHRMKAEQEHGYLLQYGAMCGDWSYREQLAKFLTERYGEKVDSGDLFGTSGATSGCYLLASLFFQRGTTVFVEEPTYFAAIKMLQDDLGLNVIPVPQDAEGMRADVLSSLLDQYDKVSQHVKTDRRPYWTMVYTVPTFNNPTGNSMTPERSRALVELARKHDVLMVGEDVYNLLNYQKEPPPSRLFSYDKKSDPDYLGNVVSNGTFSKILGPGLRCGWMEAPDRVKKVILASSRLRGGGGENTYMSGIIASTLALGLQQQHLDRLVSEYTERMACALQTLKEKLPPGCTVTNPKGGYFIWITMPEGCDSSEMVKTAVDKYRVFFAPGRLFSVAGDKFINSLRICISHYPKEALLGGVERLVQCIADHVKSKKSSL